MNVNSQPVRVPIPLQWRRAAIVVTIFVESRSVAHRSSPTEPATSLIRQTAWAAAAVVIFTGARFLFTALLARRLALDTFGVFAYAQWLVDFTVLACSMGATGVASRYFAEYRHDPGLASSLFVRWRRFALVLPLLSGAVALAAASRSAADFDLRATVLLLLWTVASGWWAMQTAAFAGRQQFDRVFFCNVVAGLPLCLAWLLPIAADDLGMVFGLMTLASGGAVLAGGGAFFRGMPRTKVILDRNMVRSIAGYAFNVWVTALLWHLVWSRGEFPIVRWFLGDVGVARYVAPLTLFGGAVQCAMLIVAGVTPRLTSLWGQGARPAALALARKVMDFQLLAAGLASTLLICFSAEWLTLVFGPAFAEQSAPLVILSVGLVAMVVSCQNHLLQIATDARFSRNWMLVGLAALAVSATGLIPALGVEGAALARMSTMLLLTSGTIVAVHRRWGKDAYSGAQLVRVLLVVVVLAVLILGTGQPRLAVRTTLAVVAIAVLVLSGRRAGQIHFGLCYLRRTWQRAFPSA